MPRSLKLASGLSLVVACENPIDVEPVQVTDSGGCPESRDVGDDAFRCSGNAIMLTTQRAVDVLFVVDDGPEAGALQARLADAIGQLAIDVARMDPAPDLRVAFTSSRDGNAQCAGPDGGAGRFLLASCRERPDAFVDVDGNDRFAELCDSRCDADALDTVPTSLGAGDEEKPRAWLELGAGASNLADADVADALRCGALLGVSGCPFPAPISATRYALLRAQQQEDQPEAGFLRTDASLVIVWVTSGVECSLGPAGAEAFDADGSRALWSDPDAATPGLCWNAGVACTDTNGDSELSCAATDDPVLAPVSELGALLEDLSLARGEWNPSGTSTLIAMTGVPQAWQSGPVPAQAPADAETAARWGVEPSCMLDGDALVPPVRHAALFATFDETDATDDKRVLSSACTDDFAPLVTQITDAISNAIRPACVPRCVADNEPDVEGVQPQCNVIAEFPTEAGGIQEVNVADCIEGVDGGPSVPEGERVCLISRSGAAMHPECRKEGWNLEFELVWADPTPPRAGVRANCMLSDEPEHDCPEL